MTCRSRHRARSPNPYAGLRVGVDGMAGPVDPEAVRTATLRVLSEATFGQAAKRIAAEISSLPWADEAPLPV